jgi:hypothetical protein
LPGWRRSKKSDRGGQSTAVVSGFYRLRTAAILFSTRIIPASAAVRSERRPTDGFDPAGDLDASGCMDQADLGALLADWTG